jgi:hypothetical protein
MNHGQMRNQRVTMIDELPNLEDLTGVGDYHVQMDRHIMERPDVNDSKYQKHIRGNHMVNPQAGMEGYGPSQTNSLQAQQQHEAIMQQPQQRIIEIQGNPMSYNCVDVAKHIEGCPICSKFYHNDKTVYIIAIVVLSIVCLLLMKRVLNV